jgi:hypothetical protein
MSKLQLPAKGVYTVHVPENETPPHSKKISVEIRWCKNMKKDEERKGVVACDRKRKKKYKTLSKI